MQYCGSGPAAIVTGVRTFVLAIRSGRSPSFPERSETEFLIKVKTGLAELCFFQKPASSDGAPESLRARPAVEAHYQFVVDFAGRITCAHLKPMQQFAWLLSQAQNVQVDLWYKELMGGAAVVAGSSASVAPSAKAAAAKKAKKGDNVRDLVKGLFK